MIRWKQALRHDKLTPEPYGLISTCETYRIGKHIIDGKPVYSCFDGKTLLGRYQTGDEAKKAAQKAQKKNPED